MVSEQTSSNELYNLRWNSYFTNLINVFTAHQVQETLVDVTLSCEGQFIKAHRLVLSACSVYFQKIFETHSAPHLLILLHDIKFKNLELVIQFMYKGEVKVADSEMQNFLALGKMLKVKGLCSVELEDKQKAENAEKSSSEKVTQSPFSENVKDEKKKEPPENKKPNNTKPKVEQSSPVNDIKESSSPSSSKKRKSSPEPPENASGKKKSVKPPSPSENPDVSHIPRPPNAFMIFANQWRKKLAVEYPSDSNKDISVRLGNMWKSLSRETKDAFYEDARKADEEHKLRYPGYYYSPKEARNRKAIANITKAALKLDLDNNGDNNETKDELIEI